MRFLFLVFLVTAIITAGCVSNEKSSPPVPTTIPPVSASVTTTPHLTAVSTPSQNYKTADLAMALNTNPVYGFRMDYPAEWTYTREHTKNWKVGYNFSSPEGKSHVYVFVDDAGGSGFYWYPLNKWANNTIKGYTESYCLDGGGNRMEWDYCTQPNQKLYHPVLASNDPVAIAGSFEARKLVFTSYDDRNFGQYTVYIMHSGRMQGYNYTVPDHPEVAVQVDGPAWDYGVGGQGYAIELYSPADQVQNTSGIFSHMINSFEITTKI